MENLRRATQPEQKQNSTPFVVAPKGGRRNNWLDVLQANYILLTERQGHQLLPDTFYQIGDEYAQRYNDEAEQRD
jgi:hypothetical protein